MKLIITALTTAALASVALAMASGPVQAAAYRDPLTKSHRVYNSDFKYEGLKLKVAPLGKETVKRFGNEVAANYDVKVVYKEKVLLDRHVGYWRTAALASSSALDFQADSAKAYVKHVQASLKKPVTVAKKHVTSYVNLSLHAALKSDLRNTVGNVVVAIATNEKYDTDGNLTYTPTIQELLAQKKITFATSSNSYGYNAKRGHYISVISSGINSEGYEDYKVQGVLPQDGFTFTFDSSTGTFYEGHQK